MQRSTQDPVVVIQEKMRERAGAALLSLRLGNYRKHVSLVEMRIC